MDKPPFDPTKPFEVGDKPPFDPSKPFEAADSNVGTGEDLANVAKAAPGRLAGAVLGLPGELAHLYAPDQNSPNPLGVGAIQKKLAGSYQAQTPIGYGAQTLLDYAPALVGGEGSLASKLITNVAAPAALSEIAGKVTEGTPYERATRIAGAFGGGYGAAKALSGLERAAPEAAIPLGQLKKDTGAGYDAIRDAAVGKALPADALENVSKGVATELNSKNFRPINSAEMHGIAKDIATPANPGAPDVADLLAARSAIKDKIGSDPAAAFVALGKVENAIEKYAPGTMKQLKEMDQNWSGFRSGEALDKNLAKAEGSAAAADSGLNLGNRIRQRVDSFLNSKQAKFISDEQRQALEKVRDGTATQNTLRYVANAFGKGHGLGGLVAGGLLGHIFGNDIAGLLVGTSLGRGTNALYTRSVANSAKAASNQIRGQTPMGRQYIPALPSPNATAFNAAIKGGRIENRRIAATKAALAAALAGTSAQKIGQ